MEGQKKKQFSRNRSQTSRKINFKGKRPVASNATHSQDKRSHQSDRPEKIQKMRSLKSAQIEYNNLKQEKLKKKEQAKKKQEEMNIALERYKQKKKDRNKKLLSRTSKGQPIMKNRIEMLLEKIQSSR